MSFADLESTLNAVTLASIGNATLDWSGADISGVFDATYRDTAGMANSAPQFRCLTTAHAGMTVGAAATINGTAYTVQAIEPDGAGMSTLVLRKA
jgi:hypothetical protein